MSNAYQKAIEETAVGEFWVRYTVDGVILASAYRTKTSNWQLIFAGPGRIYDREASTLEAAYLFVRAAYVDMEARRGLH